MVTGMDDPLISRPRQLAGVLVSCLVAIAIVIGPAPQTGLAAAPRGLVELVGALHEHSGYSDGWPETRPADYYAAGRAAGLDFLAGSEHSDSLAAPLTLSEGCLEDPTACVGDSAEPTDALTKWQAAGEQAAAASDARFTGLRGFEWTSDRFNHLNVYDSERYANAKTDGGELTLDAFWTWFTTPAALGGGGDGLATFNHPGSKRLADDDPARDWNDFAYVAGADPRLVGIEVFNRTSEYGSAGPSEGYYVRALDHGWHVGAVGAEDSHGEPEVGWARADWPKTVILAADRSRAALRAALLARRFYAVAETDLRLEFTVDGAPMGSRLVRPDGAVLRIRATANRPDLVLELVTSGGQVVASGSGTLAADSLAAATQRYYFVRARAADRIVAYSSPVWIEAGAGAVPSGEWLAGDLHVHTCFSHDGYCPPNDDNTGPEEAYALSGTVEQRFWEASQRGLDYLAITDHNDVRSVTDAGFGAHGVIALPGYENSLQGHAQMLGATVRYDNGDGAAGAVSALATRLRADGGVFQINHPTEDAARPISTCDAADALDQDWSYGYAVAPDTVEVWNVSHLLQPPIGSANADATRFWECWLERGHRVAATGGSDSHALATDPINGPGQPTTWIFAAERSARGLLAALREGRTSISLLPPSAGGGRLLLEADADGDGRYEALIGDSVPPGSAMRVRAEGIEEPVTIEVRANGGFVFAGEWLLPGGELRFRAPDRPGWVRATASLPDGSALRRALCDPALGGDTSYCRDPLLVVALTSAIYLEHRVTLELSGPASGQHTDPVELRARLTTEDGAPLVGRSVAFAAPGARASAITDADGVARATLRIDSDPGVADVTASFAAEPGYRAARAAAPFEVLPERTALTYLGADELRGTTIDLAARLTEDDGAPLAGRTLTFEVDGRTATGVTDLDGVATVSLRLAAGDRPEKVVITRYAGELRFSGSEVTTTIHARPS